MKKIVFFNTMICVMIFIFHLEILADETNYFNYDIMNEVYKKYGYEVSNYEVIADEYGEDILAKISLLNNYGPSCYDDNPITDNIVIMLPNNIVPIKRGDDATINTEKDFSDKIKYYVFNDDTLMNQFIVNGYLADESLKKVGIFIPSVNENFYYTNFLLINTPGDCCFFYHRIYKPVPTKCVENLQQGFTLDDCMNIERVDEILLSNNINSEVISMDWLFSFSYNQPPILRVTTIDEEVFLSFEGYSFNESNHKYEWDNPKIKFYKKNTIVTKIAMDYIFKDDNIKGIFPFLLSLTQE